MYVQEALDIESMSEHNAEQDIITRTKVSFSCFDGEPQTYSSRYPRFVVLTNALSSKQCLSKIPSVLFPTDRLTDRAVKETKVLLSGFQTMSHSYCGPPPPQNPPPF